MNTLFVTLIQTTAKKYIPKITLNNSKRPRVPWWNEQCNIAIKSKNKLLSKAKREPTFENLVAFKRARAQAKLIVNQSKRECWRNFTTSINSSLHPTQLWTQIRKISNKREFEHITAIRNNQGEIQDKPQHIANILANYLHTIYQ